MRDLHDPAPHSPPPGELDALAARLQQVRFVPRASLEAEILLALRRQPPVTLPALQPAGTLLSLGLGAAATGLLVYLLWHALVQAAR
ncbi:MAG: hypothetical protein KBF47_06565 [Gemmatimonadales bacterium]|nr:hypothetical protein [Gemmatimonadales bacterium]